MRSIAVTLGLVALAIAGGAAPGVAGAPTSVAQFRLDPHFGSGGVVTTEFPGGGHRYSWGYDSVIQPDGRIVVLGVASGDQDDVAVARYLPNGSLDPSFGDAGRVTLGPHPLFRPTTVAIQRVDGQPKIVLAVATTVGPPYHYRCSVIRLNPDGSLDSRHDGDPATVFGVGGIRQVAFPHNSGFCDGMTIDPSGKVVVAVSASTHGGDVGIFRLTRRSGALDPGFGDAGRVLLAARGYQDAGPVAIQPAPSGPSRIIVGGLVSRQHGYDWALWRLRSDGSLDTTFGQRGRTVTRMYDDQVPQSFESVRGLAVRPDGSIVASGDYRSWPAGEDLPNDVAAVAAYSPDGIIDRDFGVDGRALVPYDERGNTSAKDVTLDARGRIIFAGALSMPTSGLVLVGGFRPNGSPDPQFGPDGIDELLVGGGPYTNAAAVCLDQLGRVVLAGIYGDPAQQSDRFAVVRMRAPAGTTGGAR